MTATHEDAVLYDRLIDQIGKLIEGHPTGIVSAALITILARGVASHARTEGLSRGFVEVAGLRLAVKLQNAVMHEACDG